MSKQTSQQKVFEDMLKDLKDQVLSEMRSSSPDDEKIARIAQDIENLDMKIEHLKSVNSFKQADQEGKQDELQEQKIELTSATTYTVLARAGTGSMEITKNT